MTLLDRQVSSRAQIQPQHLAVGGGAERLSYGELELESNRLARTLRRIGVRPGDRVCLLVPKSPRAISAIVGILKAGAIYVPLDPESPVARLGGMISRCDTSWILASHRYLPAVAQLLDDPAFGQQRIGWLDDGVHPGLQTSFTWSDVSREENDSTSSGVATHDPAYILFTSGSTGAPKGVVVTHANVSTFLAWAIPHFGIRSDDRISGHPPLHFDLSVFDIFAALATGAQLHLVPPELNLLPAGVVRLISDSALTQWFSVPAVLSMVAKFDLLAQSSLPSLRRVIWCGEVLPMPTLRYWMSHLPDARFTNLYGPTEATIASSYYDVPTCPSPDAEAIPIGAPCGGEELLVLDEAMRSVPGGATGDLYIGGAGLSPGYWRDGAKTASVFVPDPRPSRQGAVIYRTGDLARFGRDGLVYFVGRADTQIKSRGYRIELGEIEAALALDAELKESAVVAIPTGGFDALAICCAYVPLDSAAVRPVDLRNRLALRIPSYMLPSRWRALDRLPRNANGKVDRRALEAQFRDGGER